jgi:hypothetical protein
VKAILEERHRRTLKLESDARESDPRRGVKWRTLGLAGITLITLLMVVVANRLVADPTPGELLVFPSTLIALISAAAAWRREQALNTRFNRQAVAGVLAGLVLVFLARLGGLFAPVPVHLVFARDAFILAGSTAVLAIGYFRWAWIPSLAFALSGLACTIFPGGSINYFSSASGFAMVVATIASWRDSR